MKKYILIRENKDFPFLLKGYPRYTINVKGHKGKVVYTSDVNSARTFKSVNKAIKMLDDVISWDNSFKVIEKQIELNHEKR